MACLIAPTTAALMTTGFRKRFPKRWHIDWLNFMFWGGAVGLAVEHIAHKEIVAWPPFLTAMSSPAEIILMLKEIATDGMMMTAVLIIAWIVMVIVYENFIAQDRLSMNLGTRSKGS